MAIKSYKLGPGTLKLGAAGVTDVSCQVRAARVTVAEQVTTTEAIDVLCGEQLAAEDDVAYEWALEFTVLQDLEAAGSVAWTWDNKGNEEPFEFVPSTDLGRMVTGVARVIPMAVGGDVKTRPTAENTWRVIGEPTLGPVV